MTKFIAAFTLLAFLTACADEPVTRVKPNLAANTGKIALDVRNISFADRSGLTAADSPYTTNNFHPTIAEAIRQWATDHLQAVGATGDAMVIIKNASLTSEKIPYNKDWFTRQQSSKYVGHAEVDIEVRGQGDNYAMASAESSRSESLPENPTDAERSNAYTTILNGIMRDLNQNLDTSIHDHIHRFIITAPLMDNRAAPTPTYLPPSL